MFWLAFINSNNPPLSQCITMYADDSTCAIPVSCSIDDNIQPVVEWGIDWSADHNMTLNLDKTKAMLIKFSPNTSAPSVFSPVNIVTEWKSLGVIIDQYLSFSSRVAYFSRLQLRRMSVAPEKLSMFYIAHIRSILTYCMPAIFPLLTKTLIESLENVQKLCTKMILPSSECYYE